MIVPKGFFRILQGPKRSYENFATVLMSDILNTEYSDPCILIFSSCLKAPSAEMHFFIHTTIFRSFYTLTHTKIIQG